MKTYNLEFLHWKLNVSQLKEKEINRIIYILGQSRHVKDISFSCYGTCTFDEDDESTHWHPKVEESMAFSRKSSNMAIFDVHVEGGDDRFDKLFLYHSNNQKHPNYGYVMYNTKTGEQKHKYCIYDDLYDIIMHINKELNKIQRHDSGKMSKYKPFVGIVHNDYVGRDGLLKLNEQYTVTMEDLPKVFVDKEIYRSSKSFIEM